MKKLKITAKFKYKKEEFEISMIVSGRLKDDLLKIADKQIKEGNEAVNLLHKVKEDSARINAEMGITYWREGTPGFKKEIAVWRKKYKDNKKVQEQIKKLTKRYEI